MRTREFTHYPIEIPINLKPGATTSLTWGERGAEL